MKVVIEYKDSQAANRAMTGEVDMDAPAEVRDKSVREQVEKRSPHFLSIKKVYREPAGKRGKL